MRCSPFRKAFEPSQEVERNGLLGAEGFNVVDEKDVQVYQKFGKLLGLDGCTRIRMMHMETDRRKI